MAVLSPRELANGRAYATTTGRVPDKVIIGIEIGYVQLSGQRDERYAVRENHHSVFIKLYYSWPSRLGVTI